MEETWKDTEGENEGMVPFPVDKGTLFFGPCKMRLRKEFRHKYLDNGRHHEYVLPERDHVYVVGLNAANSREVRKIMFAGRIKRVMDFETAFNKLSKIKKYRKMLQCEFSPLHVRPLYNRSSTFIGYAHRSQEHNDRWDADMADRTEHGREKFVKVRGEKLLLTPNASRGDALPGDCCFLCENIFWATFHGRGIEVSKEILQIIRKNRQPGRVKIDSYAVFGRDKHNNAIGNVGSWLPVTKQPLKLIRLIRNANA